MGKTDHKNPAPLRATGSGISLPTPTPKVNDSVFNGAISLIENQNLTILSTHDEQNQVWVSALVGKKGLAKVTNPNAISIKRKLVESPEQDILFDNIQISDRIGSLFIDLATRKRQRVNGRVSINKNSIDITIEEAFAKSPKFIQRRVLNHPEAFSSAKPVISRGSTLGTEDINWINTIDTLFVGSKSRKGGLDVSHRGGNPGFVEATESTIKVPDYQGTMNSTLANIEQNPHVGVLFIDFSKGKTLQLTGKAKLLKDQLTSPDIERTMGTGRYWSLDIVEWVKIDNHHEVNWEFLDFSPYNP